MLENVSAVPEGSGEAQESERIDALLSTALADQARERRTLVETVFGAKAALVKAEAELSGIRELIDKRDEALMEAISKNNQSIVGSISANLLEAVSAIAEKVEVSIKSNQPKIQPPRDAGLTLRIEAIEEAILQLAQRIAELGDLPGRVADLAELPERVADLAELPGQLRRDLEVSAGAIGDRIGEESASLLADLREDQIEVVQTLVSMSEAELKELKQAINSAKQDINSVKQEINSAKQEITERTASTGRDTIEAGRATVEQMVEYLTGYLQERDEQLYRARDKRLVELFQQLSDTIGRTTKRKLSKTIGDDYSTPQPISPPTPPAKKPPPLSIPRTFRASPREETPPPRPVEREQSFQDLQPVQPPERPDPAFTFDEPPVRSFPPIDPPVRAFPPIDSPDPFDSEPTRYRPSTTAGSRGKPFGETDPSLTQAMANPLSRAELARDYLIDSPEEMFMQDPPARSAPKPRRKSSKSENLPPAPPQSGTPSGRAPKPPANPRTRRKP